jgi:hypothetical protein
MEAILAHTDAVTLYASNAAERTPLKRIRRFSRPFEIGFALLAGALGLFSVFLLIMAFAPGGPFIFVSPEGGWFTLDPTSAPEGAVAFRDLPLMAKVVGLIAAISIQGVQIAGFIFLSRLFGSYRRGVVFDEAPISIMRRAGIAFVLAAAAPGLMQPFVRAAGALDENWFHIESVASLLVGAALFLFAHIMALGMEIERENKGFV